MFHDFRFAHVTRPCIVLGLLATLSGSVLGQTLDYATFLGGRRDDNVRQMVMAPSGDAVIVAGEGDLIGDGGHYVAKVPLDGSPPDWITSFGIAFGREFIQGLAVDAGGNVYVSGHTDNSDFPTTDGTAVPSGTDSRFVVKFDANGSCLYSTITGLNTGDSLWDTSMAVYEDGTGNRYIYLADAVDTANDHKDVTVNRFIETGSCSAALCPDPAWGPVVLGGSARDKATAIAVDANGRVWVGGFTESTDFVPHPQNHGGFRTMLEGTREVFVVRLTSAGVPDYSSFVAAFSVYEIEVDGLNRAYVAGETSFTSGLATNSSAFASPFDNTHNGDDDMYLTIVDADAASAQDSQAYGTYLGGSGRDRGLRLAVDGNGRVVMTMDTNSTDLPIPSGGAFDDTFNGGQTDSYFARIDPAVSGSAALDIGTYLGGSKEEWTPSPDLDAMGRIVIALRSHSRNDFDPTTSGVSYDDSFDGKSDVAIMAFSPPGPPPPPSPGILVSPTNGLETTELGGTDSFDVVLETQPADTVSITIWSNDTSEGTVSPTILSFDGVNWDIPQIVTVTGVDDTVADGNVAYTLVTDPAVSNDPAYNGLDPSDVSATNLDDEPAPGPTSMHVSTINVSQAGIGQGQKVGRAVVTILDDQGSPVPNVTVQGTFSGDVTGTTTSTTDGNGTATLDSPTSSNGNLHFTFCVDDVSDSSGTLTYDPLANVATCESR